MANFKLPRQLNPIFSMVTLEHIMLLAFLLLWIVWPLRNTIAARNIALVIGAISALIFLGVNRYRFKFLDLFPIYLLLCIPVWLIILYIFHPIASNLQWADISGTWVRVTLGMIFAVGLSKMIISKSRYQYIYYYALFIWPVCIALVFIYQGLFTATWFGEHIYILILKSKISGAYLLIWSLTFCFAIFYVFVIDKNHRFLHESFRASRSMKILAFLIFLVCILDIFFLKSTNLMLCFTISALVILFALAVQKIQQKNFISKYLPLMTILVLVVCLVSIILLIDANFYGNKINNLLSDINFILNYDTSGAWRCGGTGTRECFGSYVGPYPPINSLLGVGVNGSTYERIAWSLEGVNFLKSHPFGVGYTGDAFGRYMAEYYSGSDVKKTHSGWLDFALGVGLPGLIMVWISIALIIKRSILTLKNSNEDYLNCRVIVWSLSTFFIFWFIAELSEREFIEHFFFMLAFFSIASSGRISQRD